MAYPYPQMPSEVQQVPPNSQKWTTGLCGCFEDGASCIIGCCLPFILVGRTVEILDQGTTSCIAGGGMYAILQYLTGCGCLFTCVYRTRLRQRFGLLESPCPDICAECCCHFCSVCQLYRELQNRGFDPALGYDPERHMNRPAPSPPEMQYMSSV